MKNKKMYIKPIGKLVLLITEECFCGNSGFPGGIDESDPVIEDWDDGSNDYGSVDL